MRSMTGFGIAGVPHGAGRIVAEVRSVNGRFLDIRARLPRELSDLTLFAEHVARRRLSRGRVELSVTTEGPVMRPVELDVERAKSALAALTALAAEVAPGGPPPISLLAAVPDLFVQPGGDEQAGLRASVEQAIEEALAAMLAMCDREGAALADDLRRRAALVQRSLREVAVRAEALPDEALGRLGERLQRLGDRHRLHVEPHRVESELVSFAERYDVSEEVTRLGAHVEHFLEILEGATPPDEGPTNGIGRRLDFVLQEMVREINTLGAKAQDAVVSRGVVAIKVELERMREQVQNVE